MIPAVVLGSHIMGLGVIRALGGMNVPIVAMHYGQNDMGYVSKYVRERIAIPHPEREEERFLDTLIACAKNTGRSVLIPADDATLKVVSINRKLLADYYIVACPDWEVVEVIIDKKNTYEIAAALGIPCPKTFTPTSLEDLDAGIKAIGFPCLVKPRQSHLYYERFNTKMVKVETWEQMIAAYRSAEEAGIDVMLQELIPGDDTCGVNYNSYFTGGNPLAEFTAQKVRLSPPGFGVPSVVVSREIDEILVPARKLISAIGFYGFSCTEFKKDFRDGSYKLMEVNGRHNRSTLLAIRCGLNFPWIEYRYLTEVEIPHPLACRRDIYWIDEFRDLKRFADNWRTGGDSPFQYLRPYMQRHVFSVFDLTDLRPFLKRCCDLARQYLFSGVCGFKSYKKGICHEKRSDSTGRKAARRGQGDSRLSEHTRTAPGISRRI